MMFLRSLMVTGMILGAGQVQAGVLFDIQAFDGATAATGPFQVGDTVTMRVFAIDTAGAGPDFTADNGFGFNAVLTADRTDPNDAGTAPNAIAAVTTFSPLYAGGGPALAGFLGSDFTAAPGSPGNAPGGVTFLEGGAAGLGFALAGTSPLELFNFTYTAEFGDTNFGFSAPAFNSFTYVAGGVGAPVTLNGAAPGFSFSGATVTAVPEPSSFAFLGLVGGAGLYVRRSRRRASAKA